MIYFYLTPINLAVTDCIFKHNYATIHGAGLFLMKKNILTVENCKFVYNSAKEKGAGM